MTQSTLTRFCLVRHGETDWNTERRLQGQLDIPLNTTGLKQAEQLSQALACSGKSFDALYVSDLTRTRQTALAIAKHNPIKVIATPALRERNFGCFQGFTYPEAEQQMPEAYCRFKSRDPGYIPDSGESLAVFNQRIVDFLQDTCVHHPGQTLLVVSHG